MHKRIDKFSIVKYVWGMFKLIAMINLKHTKAEIKERARMLVNQQIPPLSQYETRIVEIILPFKEWNNTYIFIFSPKYGASKNNDEKFIGWKQNGIIIINDF